MTEFRIMQGVVAARVVVAAMLKVLQENATTIFFIVMRIKIKRRNCSNGVLYCLFLVVHFFAKGKKSNN